MRHLKFFLLALMASATVSAFAQNGDITVSGTVVDNNGEPVIGASVIQKGTSNGAVTDLDGHFSVKVPKVSIDPVWQKQMVFHINGTSQTFTSGGSWSDDPSTSTGGTGYTNDGVTMQIYNRNVQVLNPQVGDTIRIPVSNVQSGATYQFQLFGYEKATDTSLRLKNLTTGKTSLSTSATEITYTLTADDVKEINKIQDSGDKKGDPVWYWIALRGQGFTAAGMYFVKNTQSIQIHDVTLDEDNETSTIGEEPNVNVTIHRTFTKGQWNTLMFPFDLTASQINETFGPNCQVARFEGGDINDDPSETDYTNKYKVFNLISRTHIYANQPMVIKINDDGYITSDNKYTFKPEFGIS